MKRILASAASLALAVGPAASGTQALAQAEQAATINKDFGCTGFVPTSDGNIGPFIFSDSESIAVATNGETQKLICRFDIPEGIEPDTVTHAEGFPCGTTFGQTYDTRMVATPGGRAVLTCEVNGSTE